MRGIWFRAVLVGAVVSFAAALAAAQQKGFADDGRIVVSAERITGLYFENISIKQTTTFPVASGGTDTSESEAEASSTTFAIFGTSTGFLGAASTTAGGTSMAPRLALDVFVASGFSVGAAVTYVHSEGTTKATFNGQGEGEEDQPTFNGIVLAPRVGFGVPLSPMFAIWPRAGVTHSIYWASQEDDSGTETVEVTQTLSFTDLTLEGMVAVTPVPNVAIVFGPYLDLGLTGSVVVESEPDPNPGVETDTDWKYTSYGLTAGISLVF